MIELHFRNGQKVNGVWKYSSQAAWYEFREEFPDNIVEYAKCDKFPRNFVSTTKREKVTDRKIRKLSK